MKGYKHYSEALDAWILELLAKGKNQVEIAKATGASEATVSRRVSRLKVRAKEKINEWATETLPAEFEKAITALELVNRQAFEISESAEDQRTKLNALALSKDANMAKIDLLTHTANIDRVISWASQARGKLTRQLMSEAGDMRDAKGSTEDNTVTATQ